MVILDYEGVETPYNLSYFMFYFSYTRASVRLQLLLEEKEILVRMIFFYCQTEDRSRSNILRIIFLCFDRFHNS